LVLSYVFFLFSNLLLALRNTSLSIFDSNEECIPFSPTFILILLY
jgi:hypothetical protein